MRLLAYLRGNLSYHVKSLILEQRYTHNVIMRHWLLSISYLRYHAWRKGRKLSRNHHLDLILLFLRAPDDPLVGLLPPPAVLLRHVADRLDRELAHQLLHPPQAQLQQGGKGHWHHLHPRVFFGGVFNLCQLFFNVGQLLFSTSGCSGSSRVRKVRCVLCAVCSVRIAWLSSRFHQRPVCCVTLSWLFIWIARLASLFFILYTNCSSQYLWYTLQ